MEVALGRVGVPLDRAPERGAERPYLLGERRRLRVEGDGLGSSGSPVDEGQGAAGGLPHRVDGCQQALGADHFQAPARQRVGAIVGDVEARQHAAFRPSDQQGAVVDRIILGARLRQGRDGHDRLAEEIIDEIETVRRQIDQGTAAGPRRIDPPIVLAWAGRPVAPEPTGVDDADRRHRSEPTRADLVVQGAMGGMVALVEGRPVERVLSADRFRHRLGVGEAGRHRLLAQDRLPGGGQRLDRLSVQVVRRRHVHRLDLGIADQAIEAVIGACALGFGGCARLDSRIADRDEAVPGGTDAGSHVIAGDPAVADDAPADRIHYHRSGRSTNSRIRMRSTSGASTPPAKMRPSGPSDRIG